MAELQQLKWWPGERLDLPDMNRSIGFVEDDFQLRNMHILGGGTTPWVLKGFVTSVTGGLVASTTVANSALFNLTDPSDLRGTFFVGDPAILPISTTLSDNTTNYLHIKLNRVTSSSSSALRTSWDPTANNGDGGEYQQIVDTAEIKEASIVVTNDAPSADPSHILVSRIITVGGAITELHDERNLFCRLGKNSLFTAIGSITTPVYTQGGGAPHDDAVIGGSYVYSSDINYVVEIDPLNTGKYQYSEDGGATWVATGVAITGLAQLLSHGVTVTFGAVTGHEVGDRWSFTGVANSGVDYTFKLASPAEPNSDVLLDVNAFVGGDKELDNMKEWMDFVMSQIKEIKWGTSTTSSWFSPAPSNLAQFGIGLSGGGVISWACAGTGANGTMTFTSDFIILMPGTPFSNYIRLADYPGGIIFPDAHTTPPFTRGGDNVAYVTLDPTSSADLTVNVINAEDYTSAPNQIIIARRVANVLYVGI